MRVGILTYHFSDNYGALFQAYALRKWFMDQGCEASFINYHPDYVEAGGEINFNKLISKSNLKVIYLKLARLKNIWFGDRQQQENFENFRREFLGITGDEYKTRSDLEAASLYYDILVCGSDQVWNPSEHFGVDPVYFLNFKTKNSNVRRISYAPSFGRSEINPRYSDEIKELLLSLDGISIREMSGVSIVKQLTGTDPVCVPDPTVLLSDYSGIIKKYDVSANKHVFCYALRSRNVIGDVAEAAAKHYGAALYSPHNPHRRWKEIGETVYPCPRQWLYLLTRSEFVVTNSFHGTALSILLNKPFVVVGLQGSRAGFNARALNLLELVGLNSRFLDDSSPEKISKVLSDSINWDEVNERIGALRASGVTYLKEQLSRVLERADG
ncbi:polysaccharide pyruvyl transferase family protein [Methylomonas rosea]|uniref:Polysaccharide pyruvyl transferase family protein n=1 Tax=Methylomonas rosea TaxID=2952227 RepID=A0ABT1TY62_9GAMM|nr:polysaccharide pyruvyl transferase family protein [Methylomonas sp. WSC-7]MCQ8119705.1 polysaccharide pyruvyl transferase family protein [Methylomonas sp. WSC-7]